MKQLERESSLSQSSNIFKARKMPDFGNLPSFIPLLNEKPLTTHQDFKLRVDERAELRKHLMPDSQESNKENIINWN